MPDASTGDEPEAVLTRIQEAINAHDLDALASCFEQGYDSQFPAHPERAFRGHDQMLANWTAIFAAIPNVKATLHGSVRDGDTVWAEWEWSGNRPDGSPQLLRGVTIQGVRDGRINWVRLYMEPVGNTANDPAVAARGGPR